MKIDMTKEIKKIMIDENIIQEDLAKKLNVTQQNISAKFKKNDYRISELVDIGNILGYDVKIELVKKDKT
ncbi:helix-turn-helix domain-containing protein [uncultured Clostridium sp.]|uniref:helix-turn-helix domain-containing protein n=1 Tax=uncultured Clostridium sp. TaxID=59620 RepID=UPI0028E4111E|nr:helix-turn-helix domain-containing protein [uncultured Clostridium sp.]